jgi:predicted acetyltransferase
MDLSDFITNVYKSERLVYRAAEEDEEERTWMVDSILNDPTLTYMASTRLTAPERLSGSQGFLDYAKNSIFSLLICLAPDADDDAPGPNGTSEASSDKKKAKKRPTPIGYISLFSGVSQQITHHRNAQIGVGLVKEHRGKGYGGEAINWAVDWAFRRVGLHRVSISAVTYNQAAVGLYRKLGFKDEGVDREAVYLDRKFHDIVRLGMLEHEWEELRGIKSS